MEIRQLEVFAAVAELKSFSKAAENCYLTQSTVSAHIKNLEQETGKKLLLRNARNLQLTEEGRLLLDYAKKILELHNNALDALRCEMDVILRIGASTIPSGYMIPELISTYRKNHKNIYFDVFQGDSSMVHEKLYDGTIEIGFCGAPALNSQCINIPFAEDSMVLVMPLTEHYLKMRQKGDYLSIILNEPIILREQGSGTGKAAEHFLNEMEIDRKDLNVVARTNDLESIRKMIINGMGVSICSDIAFSDRDLEGRVLTMPLPSSQNRTFYISYRKDVTLRPDIQQFIDYCMKIRDNKYIHTHNKK